MTTEKFIVSHRKEAVGKGEFPLSDEDGERHVGYLQDDLEVFLNEKGISVSVEIVNSDAHITLESKSLNNNLKNELGEALRKINRRTPGLAIVVVN